MGRNKALLELEGEPLIARGLRTLREVCAEVAIAGGVPELRDYGRLVVDDRVGCGPLSGIVAALEQSAFAWNLFMPVDVPFVPAEVWLALLERAEAGGAMCVMARSDGQVQPLVAAYRRDALATLSTELGAGRWKVTTAIAAAGDVACIDFAREDWFRNVNTPEEFAGLEVETVREF